MQALPSWPWGCAEITGDHEKATDNDAVIELALKGHGIGRLLFYQVAPYIADGRLKTVLKSYEPPEVPIHLVQQEGRTVSAKGRAFVDFAAERFKSDPLLGRDQSQV